MTNPELAGWIAGCLAQVPVKRACVLDGAVARMARHLKARDVAVRAVDTLQCHHFFNGALLPDGPAQIHEGHVAEWMRLRKEPEVAGRFFGWAHKAFSPEEAVWLGIWRANILEGGLPFRLQALGSVVVMRTIGYWLAWNGAEAAAAIEPLAARAGPVPPRPTHVEFGHKPLPPAAVFRHYVDVTNQEISQSGLDHTAVFLPPGQEPDAGDADLFYCYVPPEEGMKAMDPRLSFWERWILGDPAAPLPFEASGWPGGGSEDQGSRPVSALERLLDKMVDVPVWAIAYGGDGDGLYAAAQRLRPDAVRHEILVPYPQNTGSAIINQGLIVASSQA